jgi:hypothetical protein
MERGNAGYHLRDAETGERVAWEDPRIRVVPVAGVSFRPEAHGDPSFEPGRLLALVPEPDNAHECRRGLERGTDPAGRVRAARGRP